MPRPRRSPPTRTIPYTPIATIAPDISAETGPGASGWALGNQTCNGTAPAFEAKPSSTSTNANERTVGERVTACAATAANVWPPPCRVSNKSPNRIDAAPTCVIAPYHWAASRAAAWRRCSTMMSSIELRAISSQKNISVAMLDAAGTQSIESRKTRKSETAVRERIAAVA